LRPTNVEGRAMPDPDRVRQTRRILCARRLDGLIERVAQEILSGIRLDRNVAVQVLGFQILLQPIGVNLFGAIDNRFRLDGYHVKTLLCKSQIARVSL
jgi:hypothetical protein